MEGLGPHRVHAKFRPNPSNQKKKWGHIEKKMEPKVQGCPFWGVWGGGGKVQACGSPKMQSFMEILRICFNCGQTTNPRTLELPNIVEACLALQREPCQYLVNRSYRSGVIQLWCRGGTSVIYINSHFFNPMIQSWITLQPLVRFTNRLNRDLREEVLFQLNFVAIATIATVRHAKMRPYVII